MKYRLFIICALGIFSFSSLALAVSDSFTVELRITSDTTPPSVPANVSAVPVTTTQIDVSWDASTDNDLIGGYQVFRDSSQIATTTLLSYSDTSLTPSTTYSYFIKAFDDSRNFSSSSVTVSTTTLAVTATTTPTTTTTTTTSGSQGFRTTISKVNVEVSTANAAFSFSGNTYITYSLRWGLTSSYELGFIESNIYSKEHATQIPDLEPGVRYYYKLEIVDRFGRSVDTIEDSLVTAPTEEVPFVPNVSNFTATVSGGNVTLTWDNPVLPGATVRVVRNPRFYPRHDADGYIVYEGKRSSVTDDGVVARDGAVYYAVFVFDEYGNRSSGAVTSVTFVDEEPVVAPEEQVVEWLFTELIFKQNGATQLYQGDVIELLSRDAFEVILPVTEVNIQYVIMSLEGDMYKASYLMRRDYENAVYTAIVPPLIAGAYDIEVHLYNTLGERKRVIRGTIWSVTPEGATPVVSEKVLTFGLFAMSTVILIFLFLGIRFLWK